jgi:recombination protein RecT
MSDQTVGAAVEQIQAAPRMIDQANWADVLPRHIGAAKFQRWALTLLKDPKMAVIAQTDAGRLSIMSALMDCASLGLEPGRTYHLVPYAGTITGMTDYKGEIELIYRAMRQPVTAMLVRQADEFAPRGANTPPHHDTKDWFADRGPVTGGYAYAQFAPGIYSMVALMSEADFLKHREKARSKNVWDEWPDAMRLKTLVHQLRKWCPWSVEIKEVPDAVEA